MNTDDIKNQYRQLISTNLIEYIDISPLLNRHPDCANIFVKSIDANLIELEHSELNDLHHLNEVEVSSFTTYGSYSAVDLSNKETDTLPMKVSVQRLLIKLVYDRLVLIECRCLATNVID